MQTDPSLARICCRGPWINRYSLTTELELEHRCYSGAGSGYKEN